MARCPEITIKIKHCYKRRGYIVPTIGFPVPHNQERVFPTPGFIGYPPPKARTIMALAELPVTHQVTLSVAFKDKNGNPATVDNPPAWTTDNTDVLALAPAADGMSVVVKPVGPMSNTPCTITMTADADLGDGTTPLVGTFVIEKVTAGPATVVEITAGEPEPQPEPPPAAPKKRSAAKGRKKS